MFFLSSHFLQHGRSDSYRVATLPKIRDDNKTADGMYKVFTAVRCGSLHFLFLAISSPLLSGVCFIDGVFSPSSNLFCNHLLFLLPRRINLSLSVSQLTTFRHFALTITSDSPVIFPPIRYSSKNTTLRAPFFLLLFFLTFANLLPLYNPTKGNFSAIWCYSSA